MPQLSVGGNDIEFVDEWPHLGHIIATLHDEKADIISKRNVLCGQINNVLCFIGKRDSITKLSLTTVEHITTVFMAVSYGTYRTRPQNAKIAIFCYPSCL